MTTNTLTDLLARIVERERVLTRPIDRIAYASDASFYRLIPQAVVQPRTVVEIQALFRFSHDHRIPLTFRAAGTSLSGQAITDGILVEVARYWRQVTAEESGNKVRVQPGVIGGHVNHVLKPYRRKIGPDPASINTCMMGGILANNSSGMCCGVSQNAYHTLDSLSFVLPSGTTIDTAHPRADQIFREQEPWIAEGLLELKHEIEAQPALGARIRSKYRMKNTTGYSLNAFLDYDRPVEILRHLLIGSEGALAFIAEAVLHTVPDLPVEDKRGVPPSSKTLPEGAAGILAEFQAEDEKERPTLEMQARGVVRGLQLLEPARFTHHPAEQALLWKIRQGLFPSVGAVRESRTTVIIEDVAFPIGRLADAAVDLTALFQKYGYDNAIIFGHAKDGNLHFVITPPFNDRAAIDHYARFIDDMVRLVVERYDGALKAEHGTGRNMAPFVEAEWGAAGVAIMKSLKTLINPEGLLNPGVIINPDPQAHVTHVKPMPAVEEEVDKCIECGMCEPK